MGFHRPLNQDYQETKPLKKYIVSKCWDQTTAFIVAYWEWVATVSFCCAKTLKNVNIMLGHHYYLI